jgi:Tfp pilus assembly PilM family ATPase
MIKNIFIPEYIGGYYIFPKKIVGIEINAAHIYAAILSASGRSRTIEKLLDEPIAPSNTLSFEERVIHALKALAPKLGTFDEIRCAIPSSSIVFKELSVPFTGLKKIKTIVPFEVESLLPFSLDQATIDSIVTLEDKEAPRTDILVAAVKNDTIADYTRYFEQAGLELNKLSVDIFELYGLWKTIAQSDKNCALIDIEQEFTRLALIMHGQLKYVRVIPRGASSEPDDLISEISLSIDAYIQRLKTPEALGKVILAGVEMADFAEKIGLQLKSPVQLLQPRQLIHNALFQSKVTTLPSYFLVSIAKALSTPTTQEFNLKQTDKKENSLINAQLIAMGALLLLIFISFSLYSFFRVRNLRLAYRAAEAEALQELKRNFKLKPAQSVTLEAANKAAANELKRQETAWRHLSPENRYAFLRYMTELSRCINPKDSQLELSSLSIKDDVIKLYGSVPGYQQLTKLQNQLACPLFKKIGKLQDINFKSEPITLTVNREEL